jgi:hypothetical protein
MRGKASKCPVASACEHARDLDLHIDGATSCMRTLESVRLLPRYYQWLGPQMPACGQFARGSRRRRVSGSLLTSGSITSMAYEIKSHNSAP